MTRQEKQERFIKRLVIAVGIFALITMTVAYICYIDQSGEYYAR